ncbi:MAG: glycosyltransferase [Deltaproteobacteria bacterium]
MFFSGSSGAGGIAQVERGDGDVLQLSMRRVHDLVAFCTPYEFEDVVTEATGADRVEPEDFHAIERVRRFYKLGRLATRSRRMARAVTPPLGAPPLTRDYELFFPVFNHPFELFALAAVPDWRSRCRVAACFVSEIWVQEIPEYLLELLADFDHIFIGISHPAQEVARIVGRPCTYLPLATDVLRFAPWPQPPVRAIDVCNIGRRSAVTHAALVRMARERRIFYYYDTVRPSGERGKQMTFSVGNASEHRLLLANLLQRSRYYVANRARVNEPEVTEGREEISARFYEGVAAGAALIGVPPRSSGFQRQFDWPDAVIEMPFDCPDIADRLQVLDADRARMQRITCENVRQAALRHDWIHRLRTVFEVLGLRPTEGMLAREERLRALAALAAQGG